MLHLQLGPTKQHHALTIFPLVSATAPELPYTLLADALRSGAVRITEVGAGAVPSLLAVNDSAADVLILDGEQLVGARQNRITNRSALLPAKSRTIIPVSCMEHGRWHFASPDMKPAPQCAPAKVRRHARRTESAYAAAGGVAAERVLAEAQGMVWDEIAGYSGKLGLRSATGALDEFYAGAGPRLDDAARAFPRVPRQVGLLAFLGSRPLGMDVIGGPNLYARLHDRLLRGYLLDALGEPDQPGLAVQLEVALEFLDAVRSARRVDSPTVGGGQYAVLAGGVLGAELRDGQRLPHLCAFPRGSDDGPGRGRAADAASPLAAPSHRRDFRRIE